MIPTIHNKKNRRVSRILNAIFFFIPKSNPEFEHLIDDAIEWLLEIASDDNLPIREIAKDKDGRVLCIMPWRNNYGYWTDNTLQKDYFIEHFNAIYIDKIEFNDTWDSFAN